MADEMILLVEDNPDDEVLAIRALKKNDFPHEIVVVRDGAEALDFLFCEGSYVDRDKNRMPVVILLDLKLPKVSGLEVLQEIRKHKATCLLPVVVLTTSKQERDVVESYGLGANSYIQKPVDYLQFTEAVKQLGHYWLVLNQPPHID